jgi:hypothetical protein
MTHAMTRVPGAVDRPALEHEADALRAQLKDYDDLFAILDRIDAHNGPVPATVTPKASPNGNGNGTSVPVLGRISLSEKREMVLEILRSRPGRWTNQDVRDALTERGINADGGTPVKNVMWNLAQAGELHGSGGGVYDFPAPTVGADNGQGVLAA